MFIGYCQLLRGISDLPYLPEVLYAVHMFSGSGYKHILLILKDVTVNKHTVIETLFMN